MAAPDKIYVFQHGFNAFDAKWHFTESKEKYWESHEYIRKDALLKWAKDELSHADANIEAYPYEDAYRGHREKIEELIAHIESL